MLKEKISAAPRVFVTLRELDGLPGPFCMSFGFDLEQLTRSIKICGLINEPFVLRRDDGIYDVVIGFRRVQALRGLHWDKVLCRDLTGSGLSNLECLLLNLQDNLPTRTFNNVEKGMILTRLLPQVRRERILKEFLPLLDLRSHEPLLQTFLAIEASEETLKHALVRERVSFKAAGALLEVDPESRSLLIHWILNLKLNFNQQLQFIDIAIDISVINEKPISEILEPLQSFLMSNPLNRPQQAKRAIEYLRSRRYPTLTRAENAFQKQVLEMNLPEGVRIKPPRYFEGTGYDMEIHFENGRTLREKIDRLTGIKDLEQICNPWIESE